MKEIKGKSYAKKVRKRERALDGFEHPFVNSTFSNIVNKASGLKSIFSRNVSGPWQQEH